MNAPKKKVLENSLIVDFLNALKREKIYGSFASTYEFDQYAYNKPLRCFGKYSNIIGCFTIANDSPSTLLRRLGTLFRWITLNEYNKGPNFGFSKLSLSDYFLCYTKDYFKRVTFPIKHSLVFYQFLFGTINVLILISLLYCFVWNIYGTKVLGCIALFVFMCSIILFSQILIKNFGQSKKSS